MRGLTFAVLVSLVWSGYALAAPSLTINSLKSAPRAYAGRIITLRGEIDQCVGGDCHICEPSGSAARPVCITLGAWAEGRAPAIEGRGEEDRRASLLLDRLYRFTTVTVRGRVRYSDPRSRPRDEQERAAGEEMGIDYFTCQSTRRCHAYGEVWLEDVFVATVHARKSALDGILSDKFDGPLKPVTGDQFEALVAAMPPGWLDFLSGYPDDSFNPKAFSSDEYSGFWLCTAVGDGTGNNSWPTRVGHLIDAPANGYKCFNFTDLPGKPVALNRWGNIE